MYHAMLLFSKETRRVQVEKIKINNDQHPSPILLSVIIPAYNEEGRLPGTLLKLVEFLTVQDFRAEVIVVDDGSDDRTSEIAEEFSAEYLDSVATARSRRQGACR